ncbi:hypothetical protein [Enterococcus avium]|uniref:hypothetical protein n=1 Tax=Enterococcus avium TaxID=33945 RepID=UPI0026F9EF2F|nr:hypothetical protein [Enterococcus avium]MDO7799026.1 hypothetical protein [Enterococcus avium]
MKKVDKRIVWKQENDLKLMQIILDFIEKYQINSVRKYQKKLKEHPNEAPGMWFIQQRFGSWDKLLIRLGESRAERYCWSKMSNKELEKVVLDFIKTESVLSQRDYERRTVGNKNVPSLDTLKKRFDNIKPFFKRQPKETISDFEILFELRREIVNLGLEESLSMTEFRKKSKSRSLPSVDTIMRRTGRSWEELMSEIGFDYRSIKVEKLTKNFK